ncbi:ABC transporter substrate-binding protein [Patescibacteria group bacterium]
MFLRLRYIFRLIGAFISRFKGIIVIGLIIGFLIFTIINFIAPILLSRSVEVIGVTGRYTLETLPNSILGKISEGLTEMDETGEVAPKISDGWNTPDNGKTWNFTIDENFKWQDGSAIVSNDIVYNFSDVETEHPDEKTIVYKLKDNFSHFPTVVSDPIFKKGLLGSGEWKVEKLNLKSGIIQGLILKNEESETVIYKFYPTEERAKLAFKLGHVGSLHEILDPKPLNNWKTVELKENINYNRIVTLFFNTEKLDDKTLRQTLIYAINKSESGGERAIGPISPLSWAYNPQVKRYDYNQQKAKEAADELPKELKDNLNLKIVTTPILLSLAEAISSDWEAIGISSEVLVSSVIPDDFDAFLAIFDVPYDPDQYSIWHSTQNISNISRYKNPRIDKLLEDGRNEIDRDERMKIYLDFQRFLVEDSPAAFLYHPATYNILRK